MPPSQLTPEPIGEDLENVILSCLEKTRSRRPASARELALRLRSCEAAGQWDLERADRWWNRRERGQLAHAVVASTRSADRPPGKANAVASPQTRTASGDASKTVRDSRRGGDESKEGPAQGYDETLDPG